MATATILDFDALLAPISGELPAGPELKSDAAMSSVYYEVKDARDAARAAERRAVTDEEGAEEGGETADWRDVHDRAVRALAQNSKDLWIASWLIEALCRQHGFAGLRDGFRLVRELCDRYWDGINPRPDDEGHATTVAQLRGLNGDDSEGALLRPIHAIPLTPSGLSHADYKLAVDLQSVTDPEKRQQRIEQGAVTVEQFEEAVRKSPPDFLRNLSEDMQQALEEFRRMMEFLDGHCGKDGDGNPAAPPSSNIRRALEECRDRLTSLARHVLDQSAADEESARSDGELITAGGGAATRGAGGRLVTRDDAFQALMQVADYFRRTEPHSPVSYLLEQAVRWGQMALPDLLQELVPDDDARQSIFVRAGIRKESGDSQ
jgi:type VI secretion system protein ImpA